MKRFAMSIIASAALLNAFSMSASAQGARPNYECDRGQGTEYVLDFQRDKNKRPYLSIDRRILSHKCIDSATSYQMKGMHGIHSTEGDLIDAFNAFTKLHKLGIKPEEVPVGFAYVGEIESAVNEKKSVADQNK